MAIREELTLDTSRYRKELDNANRATIKYARKQERLHEQNKQSLKAIQTELRRLRAAREKSNNPQAVRKYTDTIEKLEKEQRQLRKETEKYSRAAQKSSKQSQTTFQKIGKAAQKWIAGMAVAALLAMGEALRRISTEQARFDQKMNESLAIMGDVSLGMRNEMEKTARTVSEDLNIAVDKAAESYYFLASAGMDARQSIEAMPAVAEFAKAGMFDMATATDLATDAQSALGLASDNSAENLENMRRVTDVLVNTNQDANASVQQFAEALTNKGATALRNVNKEIEEGAGVLAAYADQGIKGRRAGEYLSRTLRIMARAASENTEEFKELGIVTEEGNLQDFPTIIEALTGELEGLSDSAMTAKLEQMGFTSEVQQAIKPLIGLSDQVRDYTESAYDAAGATEEVADNQLKSLQERAGKVWKEFKNRLGPTVGGIMDSILSQIEKANRGMRDWVEQSSSSAEELLEILKRVGGDEERIAELETQIAVSDAQELQKDLEDQLSDFVVPVRVERATETTSERFGTTEVTAEIFGESPEKVGVDYAKNVREGFMAELERIPMRISEAEDRGADEQAKYLRERSRALEDAISKLDDYVTLRENLKQTEESIQDLQSSPDDSEAGPSDEDIERTKEWIRLQKDSFGFTDVGMDMAKFARELDIPMAKLTSAGDTLNRFHEKVRELGQSDIAGSLMKDAAGHVEQYNQALTKANNLVKTGEISQGEYEQRVKEASDTFMGNMKDIYKMIKDDLNPEQEEMFSDWLSNLEDVDDATGDTKASLSDIADMADSIINVADAFGAIGDQARKSLSGISDVLRNVEKLEGKSGLDAAIPAIGVAGGVLSIASGIFGDDKQQEKLAQQLGSLERELRRNTEALRQQAIVGSDISQAQINTVEGLRNELQSLLADVEGASWGDRAGMVGEIMEVIEELANSGVEAFEGFDTDLFQSLWAERDNELSALDDVLRDMLEGTDGFEGINDILGELTDSLGQFGDSLEGAIERFQMTTQLGGDQGEAFDTFISDVTGLIGEDNEITDKLEEIADADSEEERKALAEEIWNAFQDNPELLGEDLTGSDLQEVIDMILNQGDGSASGSEAGEGFSRSAQIARSITDVQANEMIMFLERIEKWTRDTAAGVGSTTAQSVNDSGGLMPDLSIPIPLEVEITNDVIPVEVLNSFGSGGGNESNGDTKNIDIGDISIGRDEITDEEIDEFGRKFTDKLKREIRSQHF